MNKLIVNTKKYTFKKVLKVTLNVYGYIPKPAKYFEF